MITLKDIKKVMKEFGKTADEALDFIIKIEEANLRLQKGLPVTTEKVVESAVPTQTPENIPVEDTDDLFIGAYDDALYERYLAEGEARACPCQDVEWVKQSLKNLPRTNPRVRKYLEAAEGWIEKYQEYDHEYGIGSFSKTSVTDSVDRKAAEESRLNAVYAFVSHLVGEAERIANEPIGVDPLSSEEKDIDEFYTKLCKEDQ